MEAAVIVFLIMHCDVPEVLIRDTSERAEWHEVAKGEREKALDYVRRAEESGARVIVIKVEDDKCAVST